MYKSFAVERLIPNVAAGVLLGIVALLFLWYHVKTDKGYITLSTKQIVLFDFLIIVAVVFVSPLPPMGKVNIIEVVSIFITFLVLAVTSYMDRQTGTFVNGYMVIGLLVNMILFIIELVTKNIEVDKTSFLIFVCCVVVNIILGLKSYSAADAGLIQMSLFCFALIDMRNILFAFILCELMATIHYVMRSVPLVKKALKRKEKLRFPFTQSIFVGTLIAIFYIS